MKDMPNEMSGLFPVEHMNRPDTKKETNKSKTPTWSEDVDNFVRIAKKFVNDPIVESVDIKLTKTGVAVNFNYKENK